MDFFSTAALPDDKATVIQHLHELIQTVLQPDVGTAKIKSCDDKVLDCAKLASLLQK